MTFELAGSWLRCAVGCGYRVPVGDPGRKDWPKHCGETMTIAEERSEPLPDRRNDWNRREEEAE